MLSGHRNVLNNSLSSVQICSQNSVQTEPFVVVEVPVGEIICQDRSVPVQVFFHCGFVGDSYCHNSVHTCERGRVILGAGDTGELLRYQQPHLPSAGVAEELEVSKSTCDIVIVSIQTWFGGGTTQTTLFAAMGGCRTVLLWIVLFSCSAVSRKDC